MSSDFIKMIADMSERRLLRKIKALVAAKTPCGIFFAPQVPANARAIVNSFKNIGLNVNCICVLVAEQKKLLQAADNERLFTLEEFAGLKDTPKFVFVLERYFGTAFMNWFKARGADMFFLPDVNAAEAQYNLYMKHLPELHDVHEMLADDESKKIFRAAITGRVTRLMQDFIFTTEHEYFLNGFLPKAGDIAIDGGAYDGDTAADFVRQGAQVYAFEMDAANYKKCLAPAERFGFTIENLGLSNQEGEAFYFQGGMGSRNCVYHKPEDLWTLPTCIKHLRSDYEFQFRHHRCDRRKEVNGNGQ